MQIKSPFAILIGLSVIFSYRCEIPHGRQMPTPDLSALKDDVGTLPLSDDILPAAMQAIHYYTEMMQYEQLVNPQADVPLTTTKRPASTTRWTQKPSTTTKWTQKPFTTTRWTQKPTTATSTTKWTSKAPTTWWTEKPTKPTWWTQKPSSTTTTMKPFTTTQRSTTTKRSTTTQRSTTSRKPFTTMTTQKPVTLQDVVYETEIHIWHNPPMTPRPHKPGNYAPEKPPYWTFFGIPLKPEQGFHKPGVMRPQQGINALSDPDWKDPAFTQWFFQPKPKEIELFDENELQYLNPLPKKLLQDIHRESNRLPALLDLDNVNEFRKIYDDSYYPRYRNIEPNMQHMRMKMRLQMQQQRPMLTGRKKPPPTRPYVHMLMLYDLLKREAKSKKLHQFGGYSQELLKELHESSKQTGDLQVKYLLETMLERKEVTAADVLARVNFILTDLKDEKSDTTKALRMIPPLVFSP